MESVTKQIRSIAISESPAAPSTNANDSSQPESSAPDIDKKIRALKKKVFLSLSLNVFTFLTNKRQVRVVSLVPNFFCHFPSCLRVWPGSFLSNIKLDFVLFCELQSMFSVSSLNVMMKYCVFLQC